MEEEIISKLILSRKLENDDDYDIFEELENQIHHEKKVYQLAVYFYGFDDAVFGDSPIFNYIEAVFYYSKLPEFNLFKEKELISELLENVNIFIPHAREWYAYILNLMLFNYQDNPYDKIIEKLKDLESEKKKEIGLILKDSSRDYFMSDNEGRVKIQYELIIDYVLGKF